MTTPIRDLKSPPTGARILSVVLDTVLADAHLVTTADPGSDDWFSARRGGVTGTDLPKILGDSKYGNALSVYLDKREEAPDEEQLSEAGDWGHILEGPVADEWARRNAVEVHEVGVIANNAEPWRVASLDRLVTGCPDADVCSYEGKTRSAFKAGSFREDIPDDVLAQVAWGRAVSGLPHTHIGVLIGGQELKQFTYYPDEDLERFLIDEARPVWANVENGTPPVVAADTEGVLLDLLNRIYGNREGETTIAREDAQPHIEQYREGLRIENGAKGMKKQAMTELIRLLQGGEVGLVDGATAFTYAAGADSVALPAEQMRRLQSTEPAVFEELEAAGFVVRKPGSRRFNLK